MEVIKSGGGLENIEGDIHVVSESSEMFEDGSFIVANNRQQNRILFMRLYFENYEKY